MMAITYNKERVPKEIRKMRRNRCTKAQAIDALEPHLLMFMAAIQAQISGRLKAYFPDVKPTPDDAFFKVKQWND